MKIVIDTPNSSFLRKQESRVVSSQSEGNCKDSGFSITNVENDR